MLRRQLTGLEGGTVTLCDTGLETFGTPDTDGLAATVRVQNPKFYRHALLGGSLGAAEAFLRSDWECDDLVALMRIMSRNEHTLSKLDRGPARLVAPWRRWAHRRQRNSRSGSRRNIAAHYDLSNEIFAHILDRTMTYSCGIFPRSDSTLEEASIAKYDRICQTLRLSPTDHVLEIGTGWGGFAVHAAGQYGCRITTTTISAAQHSYAVERVKRAGLERRVETLRRDYRDLRGRFDKLVSIEMIEAVGHEYLPTYFGCCGRLLKPGGSMALQAITIPDQRYEQYRRSVDFIQRYIFPGGCLPSLSAMLSAMSGVSQLQLVGMKDFGTHYARTLAAWQRRFDDNLSSIRQLGMSSRLERAWRYYLSYCEGAFRENKIGVAQMFLRQPC